MTPKICVINVFVSIQFLVLIFMLRTALSETTITTRVIDLNDPANERLLREFNLTSDQLRTTRRHPTRLSHRSTTGNDEQKDEVKEMRLQEIRNKIENALNGNAMMDNNLPTHEMAAYPQCLQVNETTWSQDNNITISFAASLFETIRPQMYLDTAVLRLYKKVPERLEDTTQTPTNCDDNPIETQIRVTISTIQYVRKNKRVFAEKKKRICNTVMLGVTHTGWVEIDVKNAINIWEKTERQHSNSGIPTSNNRQPVLVGWLTIEVHDEEEQPLRAGLFFEPPKCSEASPAIPWNFYRQHFPWSSAGMEEVPRSPRLDIKIIDYREAPSHRHHNTRRMHKSSNNGRRHNGNGNPGIFIHTTTSGSSSEVHTHRKRHEQNYRSHHHHHHSTRHQDSSYENSNAEN